MTAVTAADWWEESPAESAAADRRYWTGRDGDAEPVFEMDGHQYTPGDRVRFPCAATRRNTNRIYEITEVGADHIHVEADGCHYQLSRRTLAVIGIEHAGKESR